MMKAIVAQQNAWRAQPPDSRREIRILWVWAICCVLILAWICLPYPPGSISAALDGSWVWGLNMAHNQGFAAGRDFVYTFGPLGYVFFPDVDTAGAGKLLSCAFAIYLIWLAAIGRLFWAVPRFTACGVAAVSGFTVVALGLSAVERLEVMIFTLALLAIVDSGGWRLVELGALGIVSGLAVLVKLNLGAMAGSIFCCILILAGRQDWPLSPKKWIRNVAVAALFPLSVLAGYWVSTGSLAPFPEYVRQSQQIVSGYSEAMTLIGPTWQVTVGVVTLAIMCFLPLVAKDRRALWLSLLPALIVAFSAFKHAMVRQDAHVVFFQFKAALAAGILLVCARAVRERWAIFLFQLSSLAMGMIIMRDAAKPEFAEVLDRLRFHSQLRCIHQFLHWSDTINQAHEQNEAALAPLRLGSYWHRAIGNSTVDSFPWNVAQVRANGWTWAPRPVFQSHNAYTPELDRLNAMHLDGSRAAKNVLLSWSPIDDHHPFAEDPLSWRALVNHYDMVLDSYDLFLLKRRPKPRFGAAVPLGSATVSFGVDVPVPQERGVLVLTADVRRSIFGRFRNLVFRLSPVFLEVTYRSGAKFRGRVTPSMLINGMIISPFPRSLSETAGLLGGCSADEQVVGVRLEATNQWEFVNSFGISWHKFLAGPAVVEPVQPKMTRGRRFVPAVFRGGQWFVLAVQLKTGHETPPNPVFRSFAFGQAGDVPVTGDWNGDGTKKAGIFRNGLWILDRNGNGRWDGPDVDRTFNLGLTGDIPVVGDWNGDGRAKAGVFRNGLWMLDYNGNGRWDGPDVDRAIKLGAVGDVPVLGDWNGDGRVKVGAFRQGIWMLDYNGNGKWDGPADDRLFVLGVPGDVPVVGDWNADGHSKPGVFRKGEWVLDYNGGALQRQTSTNWTTRLGEPGDIPVIGDWSGSGASNIGVFRRGLWVLDFNGNGRWDGLSCTHAELVAAPNAFSADRAYTLGTGGDLPTAAAW